MNKGRLGFAVLDGENVGRQALLDKLDERTRSLSPGERSAQRVAIQML